MKYFERWSEKELKELEEYMKQKLTSEEIAKLLDRTENTVRIHMRRLRTKTSTYGNKGGRRYKRELDTEFINLIKPKDILDGYCGSETHYPKEITITNDINKSFNTSYHLPIFKLLAKFTYENKKFDLIDLDPWGSAYDSLYLAIYLANKGLVVSYGECYLKRFKRIDFAAEKYGLYFDKYGFSTKMLVEYTKHLGMICRKKLEVYKDYDLGHFSRVYYIIKPLKTLKVVQSWNTIRERKEEYAKKAVT